MFGLEITPWEPRRELVDRAGRFRDAAGHGLAHSPGISRAPMLQKLNREFPAAVEIGG